MTTHIFCQIEVDFSFIQYEDKYQPLTSGDTIWGLNDEKIGDDSLGPYRSVLLIPPLEVNSAENWIFDEIIFVTTGAVGLLSFDDETLIENILVFSPATTWDYVSPLMDQENQDQGYVIFQRDEEFLRIDFQNLAHREELSLGDGKLRSRFNFQVEYRIADSRTRYIYGPSTIYPQLQEFLWMRYIFTFFGFELSQYDEFGEWDDLYDIEMLVLLGLPENPSLIRPPSVDFWEPQISLVRFPEEGTVYEFNILPPSSSNEINFGDTNLKVYPNPTADFLTIDWDKALDRANSFLIEIYSISGQLLIKKEVTSSDQIDLRALESGTYILRMKSGELEGYGKIIKM